MMTEATYLYLYMKKKIALALKELCKAEGIRIGDLKKDLLDIAVNLNNEPPMDSVWGKDYDLEDQRYKDLSEFHDKIVQELIDFMNGNQGIQEMIESKRKEIQENIGYVPDLRVHFRIDNLESSLEFGKWVPDTDSSLGIYLGGINIIWRG